MDVEDIRQIRRNAQRLERLVEAMDEDASLLHDNQVDTGSSMSLHEEQEDVQEEMELLAADILQMLAESDTIGDNIDLPKNRRAPVSNASLPDPRVGSRKPPWANSDQDNPGNGNN